MAREGRTFAMWMLYEDVGYLKVLIASCKLVANRQCLPD